jgi:hypothetical protein
MTDAINAFANEIFPEVMANLDGELTMEALEAAFDAAMQRRAEVAAIYLHDAEARDLINRAAFASAYADVARASAYRAALRA